MLAPGRPFCLPVLTQVTIKLIFRDQAMTNLTFVEVDAGHPVEACSTSRKLWSGRSFGVHGLRLRQYRRVQRYPAVLLIYS